MYSGVTQHSQKSNLMMSLLISAPIVSHISSNLSFCLISTSGNSGSVPAQCRLGPRRCRLGHHRCLLCHRWRRWQLNAGSVPAVACSVTPVPSRSMPARSQQVPAWFPLVQARCPPELGADLVLAWFPPLSGSVPAGACSASISVGSVPVHFLFTQIKYHRLPGDQSALTLQNSYCIQALPPFQNLVLYVCIYA